jgi:hypothetical protein
LDSLDNLSTLDIEEERLRGQIAFSGLRDFLETFFLVDYLVSFPEKIQEWKIADEKQLRKEFGPAAVRVARGREDGLQ